MFTTTPYPVPLLAIPGNVLLALALILNSIFSRFRRNLDRARGEFGLKGSVLTPAAENAACTLCPSLPELEYPHVPRPRQVFAGPIVAPLPALSAGDSDPATAELASFLDRARTVHINLGTLYKYTEADVRALARGLARAQRRLHELGRERVQALWKLPHKNRFAAVLEEELGDKHADVRVEEWIAPQSLAVLAHPNIVASVHHGGASEWACLSEFRASALTSLPNRLDVRGDIVRHLLLLGPGTCADDFRHQRWHSASDLADVA
jgi:hypothetical protein